MSLIRPVLGDHLPRFFQPILNQVLALTGLVLSDQLAAWLIPDITQHWYLSVWATSGLIVFAWMRWKMTLLPGLLVGGFLGNWLLGYSPFEAFYLNIGEIFSAGIAVHLMFRWVPEWRSLEYTPDLLAFIALPCFFNGLLASLWGTLWYSSENPWSWFSAFQHFLGISTGVSSGVLIVTTNLLYWRKTQTWCKTLQLDWFFWIFSAVVLGLTTFLFWLDYSVTSANVGLGTVLLLPMLWALTRYPFAAVYRLGFGMFMIAISGTAQSLESHNAAHYSHPMLVLHMVCVGMVLVELFTAALIAESARGTEALRQGSRWLERRVEERTRALRQSQQDLQVREHFIRAASEVNRLFSAGVEHTEVQVLQHFCDILQKELEVPLSWIRELGRDKGADQIVAVAGPLAWDFRNLSTEFPQLLHEDRAGKQEELARQSFNKLHRLGKSLEIQFTWPDGRRGKVGIQRTQGTGFPAQVMEILTQVVADLQNFLQRQHSQIALQRTRTLQKALLKAGEVTLAAENLEILLQKSCQQLIESDIFVAVWIARPAADNCMDALAYAGWSAANALKRRWPVSADLPEGQTVGARAWRANALVVQQDYLADPLVQPWRTQALEYGWRAAAALPIQYGSERWGILAVIGERPQMFSEDICDVLQQVARLIGHGMDELTLKDKLAEEKMQLSALSAQDAAMRRYQAAVMKIQRDLLDRTDIREIFPDLLHTLLQEMRIAAAYIALPDPYQGQLKHFYLKSSSATLSKAMESFVIEQNLSEWPEDSSFVGQLLHQNQVYVEPLGHPIPMAGSLFSRKNPQLQDLNLEHRLWSIAGTDTCRPSALLGILSEVPHHFTEALCQLYGQLANSIGLALRQDQYQKTIEEARHKLELVAFYDPLTGLANRRLLENHLEQAMARQLRQDHVLAVCMLDLDGFKPVNDQYGHEAGDEVLVTLGQRLPEALRKNDLVGRFGGDEFVILLESVQNQDDLYQILGKIENVMRSPIQLQQGPSVRVGVSIGVSVFSGTEEKISPEELLRHADKALYESKRTQSTRDACWVLHEPSSALERAPLAQRLLASGQLLVLYQPVWDNQSGKVAGMESLARLQADDGRVLTPREFLPQLRGSNLCQLTQRMLAQSLEDLTSLGELGEDLWISVNIDPQSLNKPCIRQIRQIILNSGLDPSRIILELLEGSDFLERNSALELLRQIRALGVRLALDDVGSAYASLLRLKDLPVDEIKLDQSFVRTLAQRPDDLHFVLAVRDLAQGLEVDLVVEGVENEAVLDAMMTLNIPYLQGRHIARPMPISRLRSWLRRKHPVVVHPSTLLGVYAAQMANHNLLTKMARQNAQLMHVETLSDATLCPIHDYLLRLNLANGESLLRQHHLYHRELARLLRQLAVDREQADWIALNQREEIFLQLLREAWQGQKT